MKLEALFDAVIVKPFESEENTYGNIIVPDLGKEKILQGEGVSVGPGEFSVTGTFIETIIKTGDIVLLPAMGPTKVDYRGEEYYTIQENQILAVIEDE